MPKSILDKLPDKAKDIYEGAWQTAKDDGRDDEAAAKVAIAAVKRAGYSKGGHGGMWHKMHVVSMHITKAALGGDGVMRWAATVSKFEPDDQADEVTPAFYESAITQIDSGRRPSPVLCVSHIDKGKPSDDWVAGDAIELYIDGDQPKSKGTFRATPLGKAAFDAVRADYGTSDAEKIRISLGFFNEGSVPIKVTKSDGSKVQGRRFDKGWIKHMALTRVPIVSETEIIAMEAKSMAITKKQDAASIVGAELAEELARTDKGEVIEDEGLVLKATDEGVAAQEEAKIEKIKGQMTAAAEEVIKTIKENQAAVDALDGKALKIIAEPKDSFEGIEAQITTGITDTVAEIIADPETDKALVAKDGLGERENQIQDVLQQLANLLGVEYTVDTEVANAAALGNEGSNPPRAEPVDMELADVEPEAETEAAPLAKAEPPAAPPSVQVAQFVDEFASVVKATLLSEGDRSAKFKEMQNHINTFGEGVTALVKGSTPPSGRDIADVVSEAVRAAVEPLQNQLAGVKAELGDLQAKATVLGTEEPAAPAPRPRSLDTRARVMPVQQTAPTLSGLNQKARSAEELAWASTKEGPGY